MRGLFFWRWILIAVMGSGFPLISISADIYAGKLQLYLNGEIRRGDAQRMADVASQQEKIAYFWVNTNGGDVAEAMRIAEIVKGLHLNVQVAKGGYCVSACFFIFIEGHSRFATPAYDDGTLDPAIRRQNWPGPVGIHRPYLRSPNGDVSSAQKQEEMMRKVRGQLMTKQIPQHLIDEMMGRPSNDIYWLGQRDLELVGEYNAGFEEALISKCGYKRFKNTNAEKWTVDQYARMNDCETDIYVAQYLPLQAKYIARLKSGWRPWNGK